MQNGSVSRPGSLSDGLHPAHSTPAAHSMSPSVTSGVGEPLFATGVMPSTNSMSLSQPYSQHIHEDNLPIPHEDIPMHTSHNYGNPESFNTTMLSLSECKQPMPMEHVQHGSPLTTVYPDSVTETRHIQNPLKSSVHEAEIVYNIRHIAPPHQDFATFTDDLKSTAEIPSQQDHDMMTGTESLSAGHSTLPDQDSAITGGYVQEDYDMPCIDDQPQQLPITHYGFLSQSQSQPDNSSAFGVIGRKSLSPPLTSTDPTLTKPTETSLSEL